MTRLLQPPNRAPILDESIKHELKFIFATAQVSTWQSRELWQGSIIVGDDDCVHPRSCAATMFLFEGLSKVLLVVFVAIVAINKEASAASTIFLVIQLLSSMLYEVGQILDAEGSKSDSTNEPEVSSPLNLFFSTARDHFSDVWNILDLLAFCCLTTWALLLASSTAPLWQEIVLSIAAIPLCFGLLRYLSIVKHFGVLVLLIFAMMEDVLYFLVVFVVCIAGFGIAFLGLFKGTSPFETNAQAVLTLFSASLNNYDFAEIGGRGRTDTTVGVILMVIFVTLTSIMLWNLLIARMSGTYQRIDDHSTEEFQFQKVSD
jgi:hypothetical protein